MSEYITLLPLLFSSLPRSLPPPLPPFYVGRHNALHPTHSPIHPFITIHKVCGDRGLFLKGTEGGRHGGAVPGDRPDHRRRSPVPRLPTERVRRAQVHRPRQRRPRRTPAVPLVRRGGRGGGSVDGVPYGPHPEAHAGTSGEYDTDRYGCNSRYNLQCTINPVQSHPQYKYIQPPHTPRTHDTTTHLSPPTSITRLSPHVGQYTRFAAHRRWGSRGRPRGMGPCDSPRRWRGPQGFAGCFRDSLPPY